MNFRHFLWLLAIFLLQEGVAQTSKSFSTLHYQDRNGLVVDNLYGITQDKEGYLWIGSSQGLFRFDGTQFVQISKELNLHSRLVTRVNAEADGSLLIIGEQPSGIYKLKNGVLSVIDSDERRQFNGNALASGATPDRLHINHFSTKSIMLLVDDSLQETNLVAQVPMSLHQTRNGGLFAMELRRGGVSRFVSDTLVQEAPEVFRGEPIQQMVESEKGEQWAWGLHHLFYRPPLGEWERLETQEFPSEVEVMHLTLDWQGRIWAAGTHGGIYLFDPAANEVERLDKLLGLENVQVTYLFCDRTGNLWISTNGQGLHCILNSAFTNFTVYDGLPGNYITKLGVDPKGDLFIGTNSGLGIISGNDDSGGIERFDGTGYITGMSVMRSGRVMVGNSKKGLVENFKLGDHFWMAPSMTCAYEREDGAIWLGSWGRMKLIDVQKGTEELFFSRQFIGRSVKMLEHENSLLLLAYDKLFRINNSEELAEMKTPFALEEQWGKRIQYYDMQVDNQGHLWLATSFGVFQYDGAWTRLTKKNGLSADLCLSLEFDGAGRLWVGTEKGLNCLDGERFLTYTKGRGLLSDQINALEFDSLRNCLWIGTTAGLAQLKLDALSYDEPGHIPLYIERLEILGDTDLTKPTLVNLKADQNQLRIHFSALNYNNPNEVSFQYRLREEETWTETKEQVAEFLSLSPGTYQFEVRSKTYSSVWGPTAQLQFTIEAPLWQRPWFLVFSAGILLLISGAIAWWRIHLVRKEEGVKRNDLVRVNRLERQALSASMNPHFIFNSLNSIQHYMVRYKDPEAIDFVAEFAHLVRLNMEATRKSSIPLTDEVERLERYLRLESVRFDGNLSFEIQLSDALREYQVDIPSMLIQPFLENAIWHGIAPLNGPGKVLLRFDLEAEEIIRVTIEDDGVGLPEEASQPNGHISRGIQLTKERLQLLSQHNALELETLKNSSGAPVGTRVTIRLQMVQPEVV